MLPYLLLHVKTVTNTYSAVKFVTQAISNDISVVHLYYVGLCSMCAYLLELCNKSV